MKWITIVQYVDLQTGEILHKLPENYHIVKMIEKKHFRKNEKSKYGFTTVTYGCSKHCPQGNLFS